MRMGRVLALVSGALVFFIVVLGLAVFLTRDERLIGTLTGSVEAVTGSRPALSTTGGTSDARFIKDYCPVVEFGLVGKTMHMVDERVALADLEQLTQIYQRFLKDWFG